MLNIVIFLLIKQDISTAEKKQQRDGIESKTDNEQGTKKKKKRRKRKTENDTEFLGFNCL